MQSKANTINDDLDFKMIERLEAMQKWFRIEKVLYQFCFYLVLGVFGGVVIDLLQPASVLNKSNYFDLVWEFCTSLAMGFGACHLILKARKAGPLPMTKEEEKNATNFKAVCLSSSFFFSVWLIISVLGDLLRDTPKLPAEVHTGVGLAAILALVLTTVKFMRNRSTKAA